MMPQGYIPWGAFRDAQKCRFRIVHGCRHAVVVTLGDYRNKGRLEPILPGFNFLTVALPHGPEDDEQAEQGEAASPPAALDRAAANDWITATEQHRAMCGRYDGDTPPDTQLPRMAL